MKNRLKELRKALNLNQTEFGAKLGVRGNTITNYETGNRQPGDAIITSIVREFDVNENWLRTGNGDMFLPKTKESEIGALVASAAALTTEEAKAFFNDFLNSLDPAEMVLLASILKSHLKTKKED